MRGYTQNLNLCSELLHIVLLFYFHLILQKRKRNIQQHNIHTSEPQCIVYGFTVCNKHQNELNCVSWTHNFGQVSEFWKRFEFMKRTDQVHRLQKLNEMNIIVSIFGISYIFQPSFRRIVNWTIWKLIVGLILYFNSN